MQYCKCGEVIPFEACPTCPPIEWICPKCGAEVLVGPTPWDEYDDVIKRFKDRQNKAKLI